jgi:threonine dehydrogenase-like Zn-dependent dehydrogenase
MKTKAVRLYGKKDLRLEEFELPQIKADEILASVVTDSICMSSWKLGNQGEDHKKTPADLANHPIMVGHEFCGEIIEVGSKWQKDFKVGDKYVVQANLQLPDSPNCPGYSYPYTGGDATYIILDKDVMKQNCLITYQGDSFFGGSLLEPLSCVVGGYKANFHLIEGTYDHEMGLKIGGNMLIMGGTGPMGLLAIDYALHGERKPAKLVVTDVSAERLARAAKFYPSTAETEVTYVNVSELDDQVKTLRDLVGSGYDDVIVMVPAVEIVTDASKLLNADGCMNFFAGPQNKDFFAPVNFYDIHYSFTHYVGTSGGNVEDMREAARLVENGTIHVENIVTHVLGLNAVAETTLNQPEIGGGKKLIYTHKNFERFIIDAVDPETALGKILTKTDYIWSKEAEDFVLNTFQEI